jgi:hypothetical protein
MPAKVSSKSAGAQLDALMRQSKQITADLGVLKHEIGASLPSPLCRDGAIVEQRQFLISEQVYALSENLRALRAVLNPKEAADGSHD